MTQEEKQLLLKDLLPKDLCGRLPYSLKVCHINLSDEMPKVWDLIGMPAPHLADILVEGSHRFAAVNIKENIRPYLRPISSMTEEEQKYIWKKYGPNPIFMDFEDVGDVSELFRYCSMNISNVHFFIDWLNAHYFDYRGLIPVGLAISAPEGMYKI